MVCTNVFFYVCAAFSGMVLGAALVVLDALYERYFHGQMPCLKALAFR